MLIKLKSKEELRQESEKIFDKLDLEHRVQFKRNNGIFTQEDLADYLRAFKQEVDKVKKYKEVNNA